MVWIIVAVIVVLLIVYLISTYNTFVRLRNSVREAFSTMDVYLKKRWDLIPNIVNTVKGYAKHEKETLEGVIKLRNSAYDSMSPEEKISTNQELSRGITKIMALAEAYPELKSNENFMDLSNQLTKVEDDISNSRKYALEYLHQYGEILADRGCEGQLVSYYATILVFIDAVASNFNEDISVILNDEYDAPPMPDEEVK